MSASSNRSSLQRLVRGLLPSALSAILCITLASVLLVVSAILQSMSVGTLLPDVVDGNWGVAYTNNVVQPLVSVTNNASLQMIMVVFGWGLAGLLVYLVVEYSTRTYRNLQNARQNIRISGQHVESGVGLNSFMRIALWRLGVVAVFSAILVSLAVPLGKAFAGLTADIVLGTEAFMDSLVRAPLVILGVAFFLHCCVVFLRLFLLRMRLFRDIPG
ncbi:MAG TPA: hypothetical protein VD735_04410 [Candidatus Saccharimonadales bacterium]|nr:hypothetical protein [Candidatus Saccharimonadales bacterium]